MLAEWKVNETSLALWKSLVDQYSQKKLPMHRHKVNVRREGIDLSKGNLWRILVGCQVTTQQRSGPNSLVGRFLDSKSQALSIAACRKTSNLYEMFESELSSARLRRARTIAGNLASVWEHLNAGGWRELREQLETLLVNPTMLKERAVVDHLLSNKYPGLGQKQSRNFIQWVGVSRWEIPLDSRVLKKMKEFGFNFVPSGSALTDEAVYLFVQDGLQQVARSLKIYPCILDACIFASFEIDDDAQIGDDDH